MPPQITLLSSPNWTDYELLDSGNGQKLERFGPYTFVRPEVQALWSRSLPSKAWQSSHAVFEPSGEESGGHWKFNQPVSEKWQMTYPASPISTPQILHSPHFRSSKWGDARRAGGSRAGSLRFWVQTTPGRHLGVFPEGAANWDWMVEPNSKSPANPLSTSSTSSVTPVLPPLPPLPPVPTSPISTPPRNPSPGPARIKTFPA